MAINKVVNKSTKSHGAMRNCIEYILKEKKTEEALTYVIGPYEYEDIEANQVYQSFLKEKKIWNKDTGRMYAHNIISWHKDEEISKEQAYEFGKQFVERWFDGFQTVMAVHKDKNYIHLHMVTNSVSFIDGHKLHSSKKDLQNMKDWTNNLCKEKGFTVAQKGRNFQGEVIEGQVTAWSKDKYNLLCSQMKESFVARCAMAVYEAKAVSCNLQEFMQSMKEKGWYVIWKASRKNITFVNDLGERVRDRNLSKTFHLKISKEELEDEFARNHERRENGSQWTDYRREGYIDPELSEYYRQVQAACEGTVGSDEEGQHGELSVKEKLKRNKEAVRRGEKEISKSVQKVSRDRR